MLLTTSQISERWGISTRRVRYLAESGRIEGAIYKNKKWYFSEDAKKPTSDSSEENFVKRKYPVFKFSKDGYYEEFGGMYMPATMEIYFRPYQKPFEDMIKCSSFETEMRKVLKDTPLYVAENFSNALGGKVKIIIKREDLNTSGTLYANQAFPLVLLNKVLKREKILLAAGNANFVKAFVDACKYYQMDYKVYISYKDYLKQRKAFDELKEKENLNHLFICEEDASLYDAVNYAFRQYLYNDAVDMYVLTDAIGPHPLPQIVEFCQSTVGHRAQIQLKEMGINRVNAIFAPANVGSNALGIFTGAKSNTDLILVESSTSNSVIEKGHTGGVVGMTTRTLSTKGYCDSHQKTLCPAMSFPALSPKLAYGLKKGKYKGMGVTDKEAMEACMEFYKLEGIFPSFEDGYSLAAIKKRVKRMQNGTILMCFTGKGDKDFDFVSETLKKDEF